MIMSIVTFLSTLLSIPCVTLWYFQLVIYLSNDISKNPGPQFHNNFFNFMSWNLNSIAKDNFHRVGLIEAHNSIFHYDLISICETCLNDSVELPETLLGEYTFVHVNNPANTRRGGVRLFYKNSPPVVIRNDLSFDESIVVELKFGRTFFFFTVLYRSPAFDHNSANFQAFLLNFSNLYTKIKAGNPFAVFFTGDFNAHSKYWWTDGDRTPEGSVPFFCPLKNNIQQSIETPIGRVQPTSPSGHTGMKNGRTGYERNKENNYFWKFCYSCVIRQHRLALFRLGAQA